MIVWIIWGALLWSVVLYGFLGAKLLQPQGESGSRSLVLGLAALSLVLLGSTVALRFFCISSPLQERRMDLGVPEGFQRYLTWQVVIFALCEAVALFGLVLRLSAGLPTGEFLLFVGAGFLALAVHAPVQRRE